MSSPVERHAEIGVAVAQLAGTKDVTANLVAIERLSAQAAEEGAKVVVFPEAVMYDFTASTEEIADAARRHGELFESRIRAFAAQSQIAIVAGMYANGEGPLARNVIIAVGPNGEILERYQKLHLYDAFHYRESDKNERAPLKPDFGELATFDLGSFRFGILNCYDIRFPEMARLLVDRGADVLLVASGWVTGPLKEMHWETLLRARAIENTCFVAASCQPAPHSVGLSMIIDPSGVVTGAVAGGDGLVLARLRMERLTDVRRILPCLAHRRYAISAGR